MDIIETLMRSVFMQIFLGIGMMVFIIMLGKSLYNITERSKLAVSNKQREKVKQDIASETKKLEKDFQQLRDTLLEHSMSLDSTVEQLKHRVDNLERNQQKMNIGE